MELMNPCGVFETKAAPLAPRAVLGPDVTVSFAVRDFRWFMKEATEPAAFTDEFVRECDAVVAAVCD